MGTIKPPSSLRFGGKRIFRQMVKEMTDQGLAPEQRLAELADYALLCDEQSRLLREGKGDIPLATRIALGRRISGLIAQKTSLKALILRPPPGTPRLGKKELAMRAARVASSGHLAPGEPPRAVREAERQRELREWERLAGGEPKREPSVLERYLAPEPSKSPDILDRLLGDDDARVPDKWDRLLGDDSTEPK